MIFIEYQLYPFDKIAGGIRYLVDKSITYNQLSTMIMPQSINGFNVVSLLRLILVCFDQS